MMHKFHRLLATNKIQPIAQVYGWSIYSSLKILRTIVTDAAWRRASISLPGATEMLLNTRPHGISENHYTILNPTNITRTLNELREHYCAIGGNAPGYRQLNDIIVFTPERTALQQVGVVAATSLQFESDHQFYDVCMMLNNKVQDIVANSKEELVQGLKKQQEYIVNEIHSHQRDTKIKMSSTIESFFDIHRDDRWVGFLNEEIVKLYSEIYKLIEQRLKLNNADKSVDSIAQAILMDDIAREYIHSKIYDLVVNLIQEEARLHHLSMLDHVPYSDHQKIMLLLPQWPMQRRVTQFIGGGPATGKTRIAKNVLARFKQEFGLDYQHFAFISTDRFRLLFRNDPLGEDPALHGFYTQDEARMLTDQAVQLLANQLQQTGYGPHVLFEAVMPTDNEIKLAVEGSKAVKIALTHYPETKAIQGNYERFTQPYPDKKNIDVRLVPVSSVLYGQQKVSKSVPSVFKKYGQQDLALELHDTQRDEMIAFFHCIGQKIIIRDMPAMLDFVKKSHIDPKAEKPTLIYPDQEKISRRNIIELFVKEYGEKEIVFIDPKIKNIEDSVDKDIYANYTQEQGLNIKNKEVFNQICSQEECLKEFFQYLKSKGVEPKVATG